MDARNYLKFLSQSDKIKYINFLQQTKKITSFTKEPPQRLNTKDIYKNKPERLQKQKNKTEKKYQKTQTIQKSMDYQTR